MAKNYAKAKPVPLPKKKTPGVGKLAHISAPKLPPMKTKFYTKGILRQDPSTFGASGFGDTGLAETPELETPQLGMPKL